MSSWIEKGWYSGGKAVYLLLPLSGLFWLISAFRSWLFKIKVLRQVTNQLPVIVVGNITVGGTGKTPFVLYLVSLLQSQGLKPGIVSRGYGADSTLPFPRLITPESDVNSSGDEPKLLALRSGAPVVISPKRADAVEYLRNHANVDVVISDDGLQHYEMARALEIVLVDGNRQFGNGFLLPAGPLREPRSRLESTDLVVFNEGFAEIGDYRLQTGNIYSLKKPDLKAELGQIQGVHLVSGIGNPTRFVDTVKGLNLEIKSETWYPDHHPFTEPDFQQFAHIPEGEVVLMTEKDAVKCAQFAKENWFVLPISAAISEALEQRLLKLVKVTVK